MAKRKPRIDIKGRTETFGGRYTVYEIIHVEDVDWGDTTLRDDTPTDVRDRYLMSRSFGSTAGRTFAWELATLCAKHLAETRGDGPTIQGRPKITCEIAADLVAKQIDLVHERRALQPLVDALRSGDRIGAMHTYQMMENFYAELVEDDVVIFLGG